MKIGIVVLSFGKRVEEPNPVSTQLARNANKASRHLRKEGYSVVTAAQWETVRSLEAPPALVITQAHATGIDRNGKPYLDSQDVLNQALPFFETHGITHVVVVANPFLHKTAGEKLVREQGFTIYPWDIEHVGFDNDPAQLQWWCKGPIRFITYGAIQVVGKLTKQNFHGIGEKSHPH